MTTIDSIDRGARVAEMPLNATPRRVAACVIAVVAWSALVLDVWVSVRHDGMSPTTAIWSELRYFTVITNLLAAAIFTSAALSGRLLSVRASGSVAVPMLMVALIYWSVLYAQDPPPPEKTVANLLLHLFTPMLVVAYHLLAHRIARRAWPDALIWLCYPFAYLIYALARGLVDGRYPYFFLDPQVSGWSGLAVNFVILLLSFLIVGTLVVIFSRQDPFRAFNRQESGR